MTRSDERPDERTRARRRLTRGRPWRAQAESAVGKARAASHHALEQTQRPTTRRDPEGGGDGRSGGREQQREGQPRARGRRRRWCARRCGSSGGGGRSGQQAADVSSGRRNAAGSERSRRRQPREQARGAPDCSSGSSGLCGPWAPLVAWSRVGRRGWSQRAATTRLAPRGLHAPSRSRGLQELERGVPPQELSGSKK